MLEIKCVFSTLAARSEFDRRICLTRDDRTKAGHRNMAQSIPSVHMSGICHFVLEKLQMLHGGA